MWIDKLQYGTVPEWFGGLSLVLAIFLFLRDRRRDDREQIDKVGVWPTATYELQTLDDEAHRIEEIEFTLHARNANDVPIYVALVSIDIQTSWCVVKGRTLRSFTTKSGKVPSRAFNGPFTLPPNGSLPEHNTPFHVGRQAPEGASRLDTHNGATATVRWFLATDNAGRRWEVRPGRGRRAKRIRWYSWRHEFYPVD